MNQAERLASIERLRDERAAIKAREEQRRHNEENLKQEAVTHGRKKGEAWALEASYEELNEVVFSLKAGGFGFDLNNPVIKHLPEGHDFRLAFVKGTAEVLKEVNQGALAGQSQ